MVSRADNPADDEVAGPMSDAEALMWRLEKDPYLASTFGTISLLDRPADFERLRSRMIEAAANVPRLRWRVTQPAGIGPPTWADDPDFDIDHHVRRISLPRPGTLTQLREFASQFVLDPLDRTRPLWQFVLVDGLRGGRSALVQKMHHSITDGENGVRMSMQFLDIERDAVRPAPSRVESDVAPDTPAPTPVLDPLRPFEAMRDVIESSWRIPLGLARRVAELLADPGSIPHASAAAASAAKAVATQLSETDPARSPLWTGRSLRRRVETVRTPFAATKQAAATLGGSLNDAFLTIAAEAAARYHIERDHPVDQLRASMAVSRRTRDSGSNAFALVRMLVPTGEMPIAERFAAVHEQTGAARAQSDSAGLDTLAVVTSALPTALLTRIARQQSQTVDFATSNVRAAPIPVYVAGAELLENYAIGPLGGVAWNLTMLSYNGSLDMGINVDAAAVDDPARLAKLIEQSARALQRAGR